jgi:integrase
MAKTAIVPCTKEEINAIIDAASDDDFYYLLFKVAAKTGRRLGEYVGEPETVVVRTETYKDKAGNNKIREFKKRTGKYIGGVQVKDVEFDKQIMMTQILKRRKKVYKEAILDDELTSLIKRYVIEHRLRLDDYLFRKVSYRAIQQAATRYAIKANVPHKVSFHNFRHFLVTELLKQGWTYEKISKLTGHSSIGTLAAYDHTVASDIAKEARNSISKI